MQLCGDATSVRVTLNQAQWTQVFETKVIINFGLVTAASKVPFSV